MVDVAPALLEAIEKDYANWLKASRVLKAIKKKIEEGKATYPDADTYARETANILSKAFEKNLTDETLPDGKLYYNISKRVVESMMKKAWEDIANIIEPIQNQLNKQANIGLKAIRPQFNQDRSDGIINATDAEVKKGINSHALLGSSVQTTLLQSAVTDSIKANADFQYKTGMSPKIIRTCSADCCNWCREVAGVYKYPDVDKNVFRRHSDCKCKVDYYPGDGKKQNVHTKKWTDIEESGKIETRKLAGLKFNDDAVQRNIRENIIPKQKIDKIAKRQDIHRQGSQMYETRRLKQIKKGEYGPSYIILSDDEILKLVLKYSGTGEIKYSRLDVWNNQEIIKTNDTIIGTVIDNRNGNYAETSVFKIHYGKDGVHIVPDYPSKKRK